MERPQKAHQPGNETTHRKSLTSFPGSILQLYGIKKSCVKNSVSGVARKERLSLEEKQCSLHELHVFDFCSLTCSEYGISRSATVVLAYLMWSECLPLKMALQDLKARKPGIRFAIMETFLPSNCLL